ncbi:MAG: glycosyltransferase, partial [Rhodospirillaceae bacterium]
MLATWVGLRVPNVSTVLATSTPLTIMIPGVAIKLLRKIPMVFEVRDQWPRVPIALGILRNPLAISLARWMERTAYANAAHIVALSPDMRDGIAEVGVSRDKISVIPNGADTELFRAGAAKSKDVLNAYPQLRSTRL